ncbi:hypothetical protein DFH09DRAFT_1284628 [Mycena vulgaris]|nr:hypothetical protein DFH09DRAFT_1284628 [Mycena vulgaris]
MAAEEYIVEDLQRSIRQVWEVALRIGVKHGQREARQAHTSTPKELERERVWGFEVGWRLAMEENALKAMDMAALRRAGQAQAEHFRRHPEELISTRRTRHPNWDMRKSEAMSAQTNSPKKHSKCGVQFRPRRETRRKGRGTGKVELELEENAPDW